MGLEPTRPSRAPVPKTGGSTIPPQAEICPLPKRHFRISATRRRPGHLVHKGTAQMEIRIFRAVDDRSDTANHMQLLDSLVRYS